MAMRKWVRYLRPKVKSRKWAPCQCGRTDRGPRTAWRAPGRGRSHHMTEQKGNSSSALTQSRSLPPSLPHSPAYPSTGGGKHKDFGTQHRRESNQYPFVGGKIWQFSSIMVQLKCIRTLHFLCLVPFMYKTSLKHVKSNVKPLLLHFYVYY